MQCVNAAKTRPSSPEVLLGANEVTVVQPGKLICIIIQAVHMNMAE
jgi:hypothetical protein